MRNRKQKQSTVKQPFQFGWQVPEDGYRCERIPVDKRVPGGPTSEMWLVESTPVGVSTMVRWHQPLNENTGLFREFAQVDVTPEGVIAFANRYGSLGGELGQLVTLGNRRAKEKSVYRGEAISAWTEEIVSLRRLLSLWDAERKPEIIFSTKPKVISAESVRPAGMDEIVVYRDTEPDTYERLRDRPAEIAQHYLRTKIDAKLLEHRSTTRLMNDKKRGLPTLFIVPSSLIAAIWLQFARAVDGDRQYRSCKNCNKWFQIGRGGRRADAECCSDSCRAAFAWKKQARGKQKRKGGTR
jgi:hypothetical protein